VFETLANSIACCHLLLDIRQRHGLNKDEHDRVPGLVRDLLVVIREHARVMASACRGSVDNGIAYHLDNKALVDGEPTIPIGNHRRIK
jgi:hypothetical protein